MTQQEQFEADYLAAFPSMQDDGIFRLGVYTPYYDPEMNRAYCLWLQQAKRHEAEIAELVDFIYELSGSLSDKDMIERAIAMLAKYEVKS